jgi:Zn-dependent M28 family amino/carboxypeptidase
MATCGLDDPTSLAACADEARYVADLSFVAGDRTPGTAHWQEVQSLCGGRLTELGYEVEQQAYGTGVNVIGIRKGRALPAEFVFLSAHYDTVKDCAGADDNGSGVAGVLEAARLLALQPHARTVAIACWDEEERRGDESARGSAAYARAANDREEQIVGNFVFDMIGYASSAPGTQRLPDGLDAMFPVQVQQIRANKNRGDFLAVVLDERSHAIGDFLAVEAAAVNLPLVFFEIPAEQLDSPAVDDLRRSDHGSFWASGYPGMLLTDTAEFRNPNYHCENSQDSIDTLDHDFAMSVLRVTIGAAVRALDEP